MPSSVCDFQISSSPRCQLIPLPENQVMFAIDGRERLRWYGGGGAPRPFFFPLVGPSGHPLTRMGHPGAPNHDHHRSIWFAHHKVLGIDFWSENTEAVIRQHRWLAYDDSDESARMAVELGWYDGHDPEPLVHQQVIASLSPADDDGVLLEIQTSLSSVAESLELQKTNYALLAVRVAKSISAAFGDGVLTNSGGQQTEAKLFGQPASWMDYSGSVAAGIHEGITYFDHPDNLRYPNKWHVRSDGWMTASVCFDDAIMLTPQPTSFRYLLHAHPGMLDREAADRVAATFHASKPLTVIPSNRAHTQATIQRSS